MNPLSLLWYICEWSMVVLAGGAVCFIPASIIQFYRNEREQWRDYLAELDIWIALQDTQEYQETKIVCAKCGSNPTMRYGEPYCSHCGIGTTVSVKLKHQRPEPPKTQLHFGGRAYLRRLATIRHQRVLAAYEQKLSLGQRTDQSIAEHS